MPALKDVAEWLGYEVIEVEGEHVVRQRVNEKGLWVERKARATAAEVKMYDAVRAVVIDLGSVREMLTQEVAQLKADRYVTHPLSSAGYYRNQGEQNAFGMVIQLMENWPVRP